MNCKGRLQSKRILGNIIDKNITSSTGPCDVYLQ